MFFNYSKLPNGHILEKNSNFRDGKFEAQAMENYLGHVYVSLC